MLLYKARTAHELYRKQLTDLVDGGEAIHVRDQDTFELLDVATVIEEPWNHAHCVPGRHWNPWLAMSEALHIIAGRRDVAALRPYNTRISRFSDDGFTLYGAYGWRLRHQLGPLVERLQRDPNDRRAVLAIWREEDLEAETKDPPCNDTVAFKLRDDRLHMTVFNRSNDLHWGLYAVNLPTFSILQSYLAAQLGVKIGTQTHISNSLHIYADAERWVITKRMIDAIEKPLPKLPQGNPAFTALENLVLVPDRINWLFESLEESGGLFGHASLPFLEFAADFLRCYRYGGNIDDCRHAELWPDWIYAGHAFRYPARIPTSSRLRPVGGDDAGAAPQG